MTSEDIDPLVPVMPDVSATDAVLADGGRRKRFDAGEVDAPLVPDLR